MITLTADAYSRALRSAVERSLLSTFPERTTDSLLSSSRRIDLPKKSYLRRPGEPERIGIVVRGLVRVMHITEEGHELTLSWSHPGAVVNALSLFGPDAGLYIQAVTAAVWCDFDVREVRRILRSDLESAGLALAIAEDRLRESIREISLFAFGDLRTRIARKLLEIACRQPDKRLIAHVTQDELASSVAAARPSVARILATLHRSGVTRALRDGGGIEILRPEALVSKGSRVQVA